MKRRTNTTAAQHPLQEQDKDGGVSLGAQTETPPDPPTSKTKLEQPNAYRLDITKQEERITTHTHKKKKSCKSPAVSSSWYLLASSSAEFSPARLL